MTKKVFASFLLALLLCIPSAYGYQTTLDQLINWSLGPGETPNPNNTPSFIVGDKIFYGFFFTATPSSSCTQANGCFWASDPTAIAVEPMYWGSNPSGYPSSGDPLIPTIRFEGTIGYLTLDSNSSLPAVAADVRLGYYVKTDTGLPLIKDIHQHFNAAISGFGSNVSVKEQVYTGPQGTLIGQSTLIANVNDVVDPPGEADQNDILDLIDAPYSQVYVEKDIQLFAVKGGLAGISIEDQGISQVPEPGFYGALALGLSGLVLAFRRRSAAK